MNCAIFSPNMASQAARPADDKPSLLALVSQSEMRQSLKRVGEMTDHQRQAYAARFMEKYHEPLLEAGIFTESKDARIAEIVLCAVNSAIFDKVFR